MYRMRHQLIIKDMSAFKTNVYKVEWLNVVFANRNQSYGAYELRANYDKRLLRSLFYASTLVCGLIICPFIYERIQNTTHSLTDLTPMDTGSTLVDLSQKIIIPAISKPKTFSGSSASISPLKKINFSSIKVVAQANADDQLPTIEDINHAVISSSNTSGTNGEAGINAASAGLGDGTAVDNSGKSDGLDDMSNELFTAVEVLPIYPGGEKEFYKYLSKSVHYPDYARDNSVTGRVTLSFVVEKDGSYLILKY